RRNSDPAGRRATGGRSQRTRSCRARAARERLRAVAGIQPRYATDALRRFRRTQGLRRRRVFGASDPEGCSWSALAPRKINEPAFHVGADQLAAEAIADVELLSSAHQLALDRRIRNPHPGALVARAGDNGVEAFAGARLEQERSGRFADLAFHFVR